MFAITSTFIKRRIAWTAEECRTLCQWPSVGDLTFTDSYINERCGAALSPGHMQRIFSSTRTCLVQPALGLDWDGQQV